MNLAIYQQTLLPRVPWSTVAAHLETQIPQRLDFALLNECRGWAPEQVARAEADLGLKAMPAAASKSGMASMVFYNPDTVGEPVAPSPAAGGGLYEDRHGVSYHGWALGFFEVGLPQPLAVCSAKLTPYTVEGALTEAGYVIGNAYRAGGYPIIGLDMNFSPADDRGPGPGWQTQQPYNIGARAAYDGQAAPDLHGLQPNRSVGRRFLKAGYNDAAALHFQATGDAAALEHTTNYDRIDAVLVGARLAPAVVGYRRHPMRPDGSDHDGAVVTLDLGRALIDQSPQGRVEWR